jgi:hypothetical protein
MLAPRPHPHRESPATTPTHAAADKPAEASVIAIPARGSGTLGIVRLARAKQRNLGHFCWVTHSLRALGPVRSGTMSYW